MIQRDVYEKIVSKSQSNKTLSSDVLPVYSDALTVSSDGPAGTDVSDAMGVYLKNDSLLYNNRPVYLLDRGEKVLYYDNNGNWVIGTTLGDIAIETLYSGLLTPPPTGWRYVGDNDQWKNDSQLIVTGETNNIFCKVYQNNIFRCLSLIHICRCRRRLRCRSRWSPYH